MLEKLYSCWSIPELKRKILLTLFLLAVYRIGWQIPLPIIDQQKVAEVSQNADSSVTNWLNRVSVFSGSQLSQATIFGLGIMPYITASIILQLLGYVYPPLEELRKEGASGQKKINEYTRQLTVLLCLFQSFVYLKMFVIGTGLVSPEFQDPDGSMYFGWQMVTVLIMTTGSVFLMWLGEQIDEYGIGNGISLLIMAGIVAMMPSALFSFLANAHFTLQGANGKVGLEKMALLLAIFVGVVVGVVYITMGQRRIPTQSAKHVRGRKVYGGTKQYLPLRVNQAGVMPIIFAQSLLTIPSIILGLAIFENFAFFSVLGETLSDYTSMLYNIIYIAMIYFFCYFWTALQFNPKDTADHMKESGTFIPGYRPGRRTEDYLEKVLERITYVGAGFLALIAVVPTVISALMGVSSTFASFFGGTGLLIAVSVAFDLIQKIDSHLVMRNHSGLLEK